MTVENHEKSERKIGIFQKSETDASSFGEIIFMFI